ETRDMLRRALQDLLYRLSSGRQIATARSDKRFEVVGAPVLLRHFPDGGDLRARLVEISPGDLQRREPVAGLQIFRFSLHQLVEDGAGGVGLAVGEQKLGLEQRCLRRSVW